MRQHNVWTALAFACALAASSLASAGTLEVAPTTVQMTPGAGNVFYVANHGKDAVVVQIEAFDWSQNGGKDVLKPSDALLLSPPMARLEPGAQQTVRLMVPGNAPAVERSFRLVVSQLPDPAAGTAQQVRFLLQFSVPVFMDGAGREPGALTWGASLSPEGLKITAHNNGQRHVKLTGLQISVPGRPPAALDGGLSYVLPGSYQTWTVPLTGRSGDRLQIEGRDETLNATFQAFADIAR